MIDKSCDPSVLPSNHRNTNINATINSNGNNNVNIVKSEKPCKLPASEGKKPSAPTKTYNNNHNSQQQKRINFQPPNHDNNNISTIQNNNISNSHNGHSNVHSKNIPVTSRTSVELPGKQGSNNSSPSPRGNGHVGSRVSSITYPIGPSRPLKKTDLNPPTPSIFVQTESDVFSSQLQEFCLANPIAVIRNISRVLKLNLGLFSTKTLVDLDSGHSIEVRTQLEQPSDENWDHEKKSRIWRCESPRAWSKIGRYAQYQAKTFHGHVSKTNGSPLSTAHVDFTVSDECTSLKKNPHFRSVTFGTNVDLSDTKKWKPQLDELDKLPMFSRVVSASNMLSHVGHPILGMNTVQLYMKVPGCRTPGHQENNNFCSVNINIGPGDCEWFGVPEEYWGPMAKLCAENNTNFVHGSWWPNLDDLRACNIPVYRFIQKPGDLVWVNTGTVHWVQAIGWCNNIAWNVGPITTKQFRSAIERYEWNKLEQYKSIVPMIHLTWNLVRNIEIHDEGLFHVIKDFMVTTLSYCERIIEMLGKSNIDIKWHGKAPHEAAHYCANCEIEVFNILFVKSIEKKLVVHCAKCAIEVSEVLENFVVLQEYDMAYLKDTYTNFLKAFKSQYQQRNTTSTALGAASITAPNSMVNPYVAATSMSQNQPVKNQRQPMTN